MDLRAILQRASPDAGGAPASASANPGLCLKLGQLFCCDGVDLHLRALEGGDDLVALSPSLCEDLAPAIREGAPCSLSLPIEARQEVLALRARIRSCRCIAWKQRRARAAIILPTEKAIDPGGRCLLRSCLVDVVEGCPQAQSHTRCELLQLMPNQLPRPMRSFACKANQGGHHFNLAPHQARAQLVQIAEQFAMQQQLLGVLGTLAHVFRVGQEVRAHSMRGECSSSRANCIGIGGVKARLMPPWRHACAKLSTVFMHCAKPNNYVLYCFAFFVLFYLHTFCWPLIPPIVKYIFNYLIIYRN